MATFVRKRFSRDWHIDWRDIGDRCIRAVIVLGWFGFVIALLARAVFA